MAKRNKITWIGTIILAGFILILALIGGTWGTTYAADASPEQIPAIDHLDPATVLAGSPDETLIIFGSNFGIDPEHVGVWFLWTEDQALIPPIQVMENGISVLVPRSFLTEPRIYLVSILRSLAETIPSLPPQPPWDVVSNQVTFTVLEGHNIYLPLIKYK